MTDAIAALTETLERAPKSAAALHAAVALGQPFMRASKALGTRDRDGKEELCLRTIPADPERARKLLERGLMEDPDAAAATFGKLRYQQLRDEYSRWLEQSGEPSRRKRAAAVAR